MEKREFKKGTNNSKLIAGILTATIIGILFITGSAQALVLKLIASSNSVEKGEILNFIASVTIDADKLADLTKLVLKLDGPTQVECEFKPDGTIIKGCNGIKITRIDDPVIYGYPPSEIEMKFNIDVDTNKFPSGKYRTYLYSYIGTKIMSAKGGFIEIQDNTLPEGGCSLRANNGKLYVDDVFFGTKNRLSLYNPQNSAKTGQGSLIGQSTKRERILYRFKVIQIKQNDKDKAVIIVEGTYRLGRFKEIYQKATITVDKKNKKINLKGTNINVDFMDVDLREGCSSPVRDIDVSSQD